MSGFSLADAKSWKEMAVDLDNLQKFSWTEIAEMLHMSRSTISDYLRKHRKEIATEQVFKMCTQTNTVIDKEENNIE